MLTAAHQSQGRAQCSPRRPACEVMSLSCLLPSLLPLSLHFLISRERELDMILLERLQQRRQAARQALVRVAGLVCSCSALTAGESRPWTQ